jgi:beta-glucosidase/6-phospho-beta-glucosidase/beta-galactosidase
VIESCRFPPGFVWGTATAALQIEGAADLDGKGPSIWDDFCRRFPERIHERSHPDVACDHYHRWAEDVDWMSRLGHSGYRLSLSWPRLLPHGKGAVNQAGLDFYDRLVDALLERGIAPNVTLYHWDLPLALQSWENPETLEAWLEYAELSSCGPP